MKKILLFKTLKNNKDLMILFFALLLFPIIVGIIYALPLPQIVNINSGDLLSYYGTAFGIVVSFVIYRYEKNKNKKERLKELKPNFLVDVITDGSKANVFTINIANYSQRKISYLYLYDEFISGKIQDKYSFKVTFNEPDKNSIQSVNYNITADSKIIDNDGLPKYVQLICDDIDGNSWNCCYHKINESGRIYYYPRDIEII